ncbi:SDR family NAD(P)-dependent oxidoreductase [Streptomyces alfalfae]|uniref:Short-chain dehydrogenase n=1 Tax=Streptomyces alfalfae TaxID=1642299 RepID=A0ABN4VHR2_9ACTN|nr:SDR family NAD(P)-dependent oxidoreductase [Streptomyces alfalfae]AYA17536.1 SDR family oxidoreductase [Streptomyces fradiae]APY87136.1 short-chain dehydrogenase [Streptomyces alfalfae]QUI33080.1 SDR family oxidoreductase [Streptomyces alfalfae]RXX44746.1 SDR family NAD(P)-dependent oxidoreductase [Streptomyces alfalfae]RZM95459.1 SDR family oxidoreductase [Streptomyces alfalfae]
MRDGTLPGLSGRVALVTGGSGGIGAGVAARFAAAGAAVVVHYRGGAARARDVVERIEQGGGEAIAVAADLTREAECRRLVEEARAWRGRLDSVVNSAGIQPVRELPGMTAQEWRGVVDANLTGAFCCTQAAAEVMAGQDGGGSVTHVASIEGTSPAPGHAHYSASKAALIMFARSAALEYGPRGVRVNTVSPGLVDRPGLAEDWPDGVARWRAAAPLGRLGRPEDVGNACVFLASEAAAWISGTDLVVDGGVGARPTW